MSYCGNKHIPNQKTIEAMESCRRGEFEGSSSSIEELINELNGDNDMDNKTTTELFECVCHSDEHALIFHIDEEDGSIYASVFLNSWESFFKRVWHAVKYLLGHKSKYGHFDSFIMRSEDRNRFRKMLTLSENREMMVHAERYKEKHQNNLHSTEETPLREVFGCSPTTEEQNEIELYNDLMASPAVVIKPKKKKPIGKVTKPKRKTR